MVGKDGNTVGLSSIMGSSLVHNYICFEFPAVFYSIRRRI